jgi:hypothetical protein
MSRSLEIQYDAVTMQSLEVMRHGNMHAILCIYLHHIMYAIGINVTTRLKCPCVYKCVLQQVYPYLVGSHFTLKYTFLSESLQISRRRLC